MGTLNNFRMFSNLLILVLKKVLAEGVSENINSKENWTYRIGIVTNILIISLLLPLPLSTNVNRKRVFRSIGMILGMHLIQNFRKRL